jgi:hypothetical protein
MSLDLHLAPASSRIAPWHSEGDRFHHDNAQCIYVDLVGSCERRPGEEGRPLCDLCRRLNALEESFESQLPLRF